MAKEIICSSCGGHFPENIPKCPYCGSLNYAGAEAEYLKKLDDVKEDVEELKEVPVRETKKAFAGQMKRLWKILLIIGVVVLLLIAWNVWDHFSDKRDQKADYLWKQENYPVMDEMYEQGGYDKLLQFYRQASLLGHPVYGWEHAEFCEVYQDIQYVKSQWSKIETNPKTDQTDYAELLYYELGIIGMIGQNNVLPEDQEILSEDIEAVTQDYDTRWQMSEEDKQSFQNKLEENLGYVSYEDCVKYAKTWYKEHHDELAGQKTAK